MSVDSRHRASLEKTRRNLADNDLMLQAYGRYWLPYVERIAETLEKIEGHLANLAGQVKGSANGKAGNDDK